MHGTPLTIYLLGIWLGSRFPALRATHAGGHLRNDLIGWKCNPHLSPFHLASYTAIGDGFWLIAAWRVLHEAAEQDRLAISGPFVRVRHPQYDGFPADHDRVLLQLPTVPALVMFPVLVMVYARLARAEDRELTARFGRAWAASAALPASLRRPGRAWSSRPGG